jgi:hypothetical protein
MVTFSTTHLVTPITYGMKFHSEMLLRKNGTFCFGIAPDIHKAKGHIRSQSYGILIYSYNASIVVG